MVRIAIAILIIMMVNTINVQWVFDQNQANDVVTDRSGLNVNQQPVIGILTQTMDDALKFVDQKIYKSYIMKSYVTYLEMAGAQVIPILYDESNQSLEHKLKLIDGLFFPGGAGDYYQAGKYLFKRILQINDQGRYMPIWGTCLGFEAILNYTHPNILKEFGINHQSINIQLINNARHSQMYSEFTDYDINLLQTHNLTLNNHDYSVRLEDMKNLTMFEPTAVSYNQKQQQFVASYEAKKYPIYAVQFHPEKPFTIYKKNTGVNHSWESIRVQRKFADFFVKLTRMHPANRNDIDIQSDLIENYRLVTSNTGYGDVYVFKQPDTRYIII